jgi:hypothetical protein
MSLENENAPINSSPAKNNIPAVPGTLIVHVPVRNLSIPSVSDPDLLCPDSIRIQGFDDQKLQKFTVEKII